MAVMLVVFVGCVLRTPPNYVLVNHSSVDAHALRYPRIKTVHLGFSFRVVELPIVMYNHDQRTRLALAGTSGLLSRCGLLWAGRARLTLPAHFFTPLPANVQASCDPQV
jgi:hypothetical protein